MTKNSYNTRISFTEEQQKIILSHYGRMSARGIVELLKQHDPATPFNDQQIYSYLRRVKREAKGNYQTLIENNQQENAEKLKSQMESLIPNKRNEMAVAIHKILNNLIGDHQNDQDGPSATNYKSE